MQINLRKASAIQAEIKRVIASLEMRDDVRISEFAADAFAVVSTASLEYAMAVSRKEALTIALYNIRKSVATANATAGVSEILGDIEMKDALSKLYESVAGVRTKMVEVDELDKRLEKLRNTPPDQQRYGMTDVTSGVVSKSVIENAKTAIKTLRRQKQGLQDKLLSINVNTLITVSDADAKVLGEEGIL